MTCHQFSQTPTSKSFSTILLPPSDATDVDTLTAELHAGGRLTPTIILRAICMGDMAFFECAVYDQTGLPNAFYPAIRAAIDVGAENEHDGGENDRERFQRRMIERLLTNFDDPNSKIADEDIDYLFDKLNKIGALIALPA